MSSTAGYREGARRLIHWLADEYDESGASKSAPGNVQFYYKAPSVFAYCGNRALALRTLEQIEKRFLKQGQLDLQDDPFAFPWSAYIAGWIAWGAGQLGRFDLARQVMASVAGRQDPAFGGFVHESNGVPIQDTERTSAAAMGCVWAMDLPRAERAARFLEYALERRSEEEFSAYFDLEGNIVADRTDRNAYFSLSDEQARPALFATGVASLVWLGRATGNRQHYDLAGRYLDFILSHKSDPARMALNTKMGWAALMLSVHIKKSEYREFARRSADTLLARQLSDGSIEFDAVPDVPKPIDKVWLVGWGVDAALSLMAMADGAA
jgi:hypothetical protein